MLVPQDFGQGLRLPQSQAPVLSVLRSFQLGMQGLPGIRALYWSLWRPLDIPGTHFPYSMMQLLITSWLCRKHSRKTPGSYHKDENSNLTYTMR